MFWKCFLTELFALVNIRMRRKRVTLSDVTHHLFCWQTTTILFSIWTRLATLKQFFNIYKVPEKKTGVKKILMENNLTSNQVLEDAENQIREACEVLQREATWLRPQKAIDAMSEKIEHFHLLSIVNLHVGGRRFTTSLQTLTKDPDSMLAAMFSGKLEVTPLEDGAFFIDRDGKHFRFILNYICTGKLTLPKGDKDRRNYGRSFIRSKGF